MSKVLFIAPRFYSYHEFMKNELINCGNEVDYFDDRPDASFFTKALIRINKKLINGKIKKYFQSILEKAKKEQYDIVLVVYGQSFSCDMFKQLRKTLPNAKFIFYMFDPISSMPDRLEVAKIFDKAYTFDIDDYEKYEFFEFLPLFYCKDNYEEKQIEYDYCVLTTMMPGKYEKIHEITQELNNDQVKMFKYLYLQSKLVWLYYKLTKKEFKRTKKKEFSYKRLPYDESVEILEKSNVIIDCPKKGQSGLTIRTLECLAANKKLITTNKTVLKYDFYRPENIYVYEGKIDYSNIFFKSKYCPIEDTIKQRYSLHNWTRRILSE